MKNQTVIIHQTEEKPEYSDQVVFIRKFDKKSFKEESSYL